MQTEDEKREKRRIRQKLWRAKTRKQRRVKAKEYRQKNREKLLEQSKQRYQTHKTRYRAYAKKNANQKRLEIRTKFDDLMKDKVCNRCKFSDTRALVWHHTDPKTKSNGIGTMVGTGSNWNKILIEIAKCECLCANCHTIHHKIHSTKKHFI
jgi:hypothetical protein